MVLYLPRHGETEFNVAGRFQGQQDSPLTGRGADRARAECA
ncbi:MAG: histidine phosphatase family protein [Kiloniellales bacterium]|jgi:probable phosphoglycerate mutase